MSSKNVWLSLIVFALILFGSTANAVITRVEGTDVFGEGTRNEFSIRGVEVWLEGDRNVDGAVNLGNLQVMAQERAAWRVQTVADAADNLMTLLNKGAALTDAEKDQINAAITMITTRPTVYVLASNSRWLLYNGAPAYNVAVALLTKAGTGQSILVYNMSPTLAGRWVNILTGYNYEGGQHGLVGYDSTTVNPTTSQVFTTSRGEYSVKFMLPFNLFAPGATSGFRTVMRFSGLSGNNAGIEEGIIAYDVQVPRFDRVDGRFADVVKNGDTLEFNLRMETVAGDEIEVLTILPDFSNVDSAFAGTVKANDAWQYNLNGWDPADPGYDLYDLVQHVRNAINAGRLNIEEQGSGRYRITYKISQQNQNGPTAKTVRIYAIDYPSTLDINRMLGILGLSAPVTNLLTYVHAASWQTGVDYDGNGRVDVANVNMDNKAPSFDFVMIDPFTNPPKGMELNGKMNYFYKKGDTIRVLVQVNSTELTEEEMRQVDVEDVLPDGTRVMNLSLRDVQVIADISNLLAPGTFSTTDANGNGIPDAAEIRAEYAGANGLDDDFDGEAGESRDDEDLTTNGFNEQLMFIIKIPVTDNFKGVSGNPFYTVNDLPIRFMIQDRAGNKSFYDSSMGSTAVLNNRRNSVYVDQRYSGTAEAVIGTGTTRTLIDNDANWMPGILVGATIIPNIAEPTRSYTITGNTENGIYFTVPAGTPVITATAYRVFGEAFFPGGFYGMSSNQGGGSIAFEPNPALFPTWGNGRQIVENWNKPWYVTIDGAAPSVSKITELKLGGQNVLGPGNFIYEIGGTNPVSLTVEFPSDNDVDRIEFVYSDTDTPGSYKPFKGIFTGDVNVTGYPDRTGNVTDAGFPGASVTSGYHKGISGDDDSDRQADFADPEVRDAINSRMSDRRDNDADGLVDADDDDEQYNPAYDEDEDGIMDEDQHVRVLTVAETNSRTVTWTFDPVVLARALKLTPGKAYAIKALAYDKAGNMVESAASPIYVVFRVYGPGIPSEPGTAKAILKRDGEEINNTTVPENSALTLEAEPIGTVTSVSFQYILNKDVTSYSGMAEAVAGALLTDNEASWTPNALYGATLIPDINNPSNRYTVVSNTAKTITVDRPITGISTPTPIYQVNLNWLPLPDAVPSYEDRSYPFKIQWTPRRASFPGYVSGQYLYISAFAGRLGNLGKYQVVSGLNLDPQTFSFYDPPIPSGAPIVGGVQPDVAVAITDATAPVLVIKQVGDDTNLADGALVPVANNVLLMASTDPIGNPGDIKKAIFQYALVSPDGTTVNWVDIPGTVDLTIIPQAGGTLAVVQAVSRWDTTGLVPGNVSKRYDIRCVVEDSSGNRDYQRAPIAHVVVGKGKYAAFMTDPLNGQTVSIPPDGTIDLKATTYNPNDLASVAKVIFQFRKDGSTVWSNVSPTGEDTTGTLNALGTGYEWTGEWDIRDLSGVYYLRALTLDDRGYVNEGIEIKITIQGVTAVRAKISNFSSDETKNPRVSKKIAREGTVADITLAATGSGLKNLETDTVKVILRATVTAGSPDRVKFQYAVNSLTNPVDPKSNVGWKDIGTDTNGGDGWSYEWLIDEKNAPELWNATVSQLVYIRALAGTSAGFDASDPNNLANFVPYVALVFEEMARPTVTIERIIEDGKNLEDFSAPIRITGNEITLIPRIIDHPGTTPITDHRASGIVKMELYYKYNRTDSYDGDTLLWKKAAEDTEPPFAITWNIANVPSGKYDLLLIATDQAGNLSANIWNNRANLSSLIRVVTIDHTGPNACFVDPRPLDGAQKMYGKTMLVGVTSYKGYVDKVRVYYSLTPAIPPEVRTGEGTYQFQYVDQNNNGQWDQGEPWWLITPIAGAPVTPVTPTAQPSWVLVSEVSFTAPSIVGKNVYNVNDNPAMFSGYYYLDTNGSGHFDVCEPLWRDLPGGNAGRYNYHDRTVKEEVIIGITRPADETAGTSFAGLASSDVVRNLIGNGGVLVFADIDNNGAISKADFIWIDLPTGTKNVYDSGEPIVYAPVSITWPDDKFYSLPPTNNSQFDLKVEATDLPDTFGHAGNTGDPCIGPVRVSNISASITAINGRGLGDFTNQYIRTTGNEVKVRVRVRPQPPAGAQVYLLFRYDDKLYPGAIDTNRNGLPDNNNIVNSRSDGIDNDWDGVVDEAQDGDPDGTQEWAEVNTWQVATTTGGTTVVASNAGEYWYEVELTWDVSMLKDEFQYELVPMVVDAQGFRPNIGYGPGTSSDAPFGHGMDLGNLPRIIVDHQGPYTYTQIMVNSDSYGSTERTLDSWTPVYYIDGKSLIVRHNANQDGNGNGVPNEPGDGNNWQIYDMQAKTVSIYGGLYYTKTFGDTVGGVEFQYRKLPDGQWTTLAYDYDPDYMSTFRFENGKLILDSGPNSDRGLLNDLAYVGTMIEYLGTLKGAATVPSAAWTQRIAVATWSVDNLIDVLNTVKFPFTNGAQYQFRAIARDLPDAYGNPGNATSSDPATATAYDERVIRSIGSTDYAINGDVNKPEQDFLRSINWRLGAPFGLASAADPAKVFPRPLADGVNNRIEYVMGPRYDGKVDYYVVDNIVPKAEIVRIDEKTFTFTPSAGIDPASRAAAVDAVVVEGDDVLIEAIVNADPENKLGASTWGNDANSIGDITKVRFFAYKSGYTGSGITGWLEVGMGHPEKGDTGTRFTARIDTAKLVQDLGIASAANRDVTLMAMAIDDNGNEEPMAGEIVIRISDMKGPRIALGGLAIDFEHFKKGAGDRLLGITADLWDKYIGTDAVFTDTTGLDLNNLGNAVFPANPLFVLSESRRPIAKVSGEWLDLYVINTGHSIGEIPASTGVKATVYDQNNQVFATPTVKYSVDSGADSTFALAKVPHKFTLSEQAALIYLPTWVEDSKTKSRFERVFLHIASRDNNPSTRRPTTDVPPSMPYGDAKAMSMSYNEKGEPIWSVTVDLEVGKTYYYYFEVDTVGDTWYIPDPKNLLADVSAGTMWEYFKANKEYLTTKNIFLNLPVISKIYVPGTATFNAIDDEVWYFSLDLSTMPDGVYEVRVEATDTAGYKTMVSKSFVVDRTPPAIDAVTDLKVPGRVPAGKKTVSDAIPVIATIRDSAGVNAVETAGVLFEISRRGNTQEATSVWQYAISPKETEIDLPNLFGFDVNGWIRDFGYTWLGKVAIDVDPSDGWSAKWATPETDQNFKYYMRAVPIDDALNVQVSPANQVLVWVDGTVPKAKVVKASVVRDGVTISGGANGFELRPTDKDVVLTAEMVANLDGDLDMDGKIDPSVGENVNLGVKGVTFYYSINEPVGTQPISGQKWYPIPATQYSTPVPKPNADGTWTVTWQVDFSKLAVEGKDQYFHVRAVAEDEVGNVDGIYDPKTGNITDVGDPIVSIMVLNKVTGPKVAIKTINGTDVVRDNALSPHLAVTKGKGKDPSAVDVVIEAYNVASLTLEYRPAGAPNWTTVKTVTKDISNTYAIPWTVTTLPEGKYELRAVGFDADGNATTEPQVISVIVDHSEPAVTSFKMLIDQDNDTDHTYERTIYPGDSIYRYRIDGHYCWVKFEVKADATEPVDKVEAKSVVLQYFNRSALAWQDVKLANGASAAFSYSKNSDIWSLTLTGDNALGKLLDLADDGQTNKSIDGKIFLRALVTDYAGNQNNLDKGIELTADAFAPSIIAVYSGSRGYEGGEDPTIVAKAGDTVDLWAKVADVGTGVSSVNFRAQRQNPTSLSDEWVDIPNTAAKLVSTNGQEELWHVVWTTPKNQAGNNYVYTISAKAVDKAGNSVTSEGSNIVTRVKVELDVTPPEPPKVLFVVTHAASVTNNASLPQILDEFNAVDYGIRKMLPIGADTEKDTGRADKYQVFDLYNDWAKNAGYISPDQNDNVLEIWVRTPAVERHVVDNVDTTTYRQWENWSAKAGLGSGNGPSYILAPFGATDPGIEKVWIEFARDPNQDGDPSDITNWLRMGKGADWVDPRVAADKGLGEDVRVPLTAGDIVKVPVYDADGNHKGYEYYWVMGDQANETIWNTEASVNNAGETLDPRLAQDGIYFIRTRAVDKSGNTSAPGYAKIIIRNQDDIPPANTTIYAVNKLTDSATWAPLEWKWHKVTVRTKRNTDARLPGWYLGGTNGKLDANTNNKFFGDIDGVVVQAFDNESGTWVNVTKNAYQIQPGDNYIDGTSQENFDNSDRMAFYCEWTVEIDSTYVGDGNSKLRAYAFDNGGRLVGGVGELHNQHNSDRRNLEDAEKSATRDIKIDNPRAQVVLPKPGTPVERGEKITIQAVPVSPAGDPARNGHDVGQVAFMIKRQGVTGGVSGPWILLDALDSDLDGEFGENGDPIDPSDTNEPYMIEWRVPGWLVIDDPQTETVIEETAKYWVVAVAGDSNTGPLYPGYDPNAIHWDNPWHIIDHAQSRASWVTVYDNHPPRTRITQVDRYNIPSELKVVVGKTVTVFAGDAEPAEIPDNDRFPELALLNVPELKDAFLYAGQNPSLIPANYGAAQLGVAWPADKAAWVIGFLYPPMYNPDVEWDKRLYVPSWSAGKPAEWRANERVTLRYAGPYADDARAPALPAAGQSWDETAWKVAEANAVHLFDNFDPTKPDWKVTNWVTGGSVLPDGKYFITVTATDDVGHTTGKAVGTTDPVIPHIVEIWIKNTVKPVTVSASMLRPDGTLTPITNGELERGEPIVLSVDPKMDVADLDKVEWQYKLKNDYDWKTIEVIDTQPYTTTLSPLGDWDPSVQANNTLVLGAVYQFRAVAYDSIGNSTPSSNIIELKVVDNVSNASIVMVERIDGFNTDESYVGTSDTPNLRFTGNLSLYAVADADAVRATFLFRPAGTEKWTEIETVLSLEYPLPSGSELWQHLIEKGGMRFSRGELGYFRVFEAKWNTVSLPDGQYEVAVLVNRGTEDKNYNVSDVVTVTIDHNAYDIVDSLKKGPVSPVDGAWVGGWTRRPVTSQNPVLDPDQKEPIEASGEIDVFVTATAGLLDIDMGVSPTTPEEPGAQSVTLNVPSVTFEYRPTNYPNIGDETKDDSSIWTPINGKVVYDAATKRFSTVWKTNYNGRVDIRVRIVDEAGNVAYWIFARNVVVDNSAPEVAVTSVNGDTTLTYTNEADVSARATELAQGSAVTIKATAIDALTDVAYVQFQVMALRLQRGPSIAGDDDEHNTPMVLDPFKWTDIGLATKDADPKNSYSLLWDTTGLFEGDYALRAKAVDRVGNMTYSQSVVVTVIDTKPPVATIVGYYPKQLHFLNWPKKYWLDTIYAATISQADVQEVQFQYRSANDPKWITIGVPARVTFEQLDSFEGKLATIDSILGIGFKPLLFPPAVAINEAIVEAFNWAGLWGTTWDPKLADGTYQLRAVAKDWSGNVDPDKAPVFTFSVVNGVVVPQTPASGIKISFTADLGGTGIGDRSGQWVDVETAQESVTANYTDRPSALVWIEAPSKPIALLLAEVNVPDGLSFGGGQVQLNPGGLIFGGEILDVKAVEGELGKYVAVLKGDELPLWIGNRVVTLPYLEFLRLGGKLTVFATTNDGITGTAMAMDDIRVFPVTAQLGTNGTVYSKDKVVSVTVPPAALVEPQPYNSGTKYIERAGLMISPAITPNTPKDQRLIIEPVGQAYSIEFFNNWSGSGPWYADFRPGFEPKITIDYSGFGIPADAEARGFISVRYWDPQPYGDSTAFGGRWMNDEIINLNVDTKTKKVSFNLKRFGNINDANAVVPYRLFSLVLEKSLGRISDIKFYDKDGSAAYVYPSDPSISYLDSLGRVAFRISDPAGVDENSIKVYVDGTLVSVGIGAHNPASNVNLINVLEDHDRVYVFNATGIDWLKDGLHTLRIEAWDKSDAVNEANWQMIESTAKFFIDTTPPVVVSHTALRGGVRYFNAVNGATASITIVDEGVGVDGNVLQQEMYVDVFKHLTPSNTPLRTVDQGFVVNYQRKVLVATSKPILEYCDDYTNDGIDNETWKGFTTGTSNERHKAWRASYTLQVGQVADGDTYEVVFYNIKPVTSTPDTYNENVVYLYEDTMRRYFATWDGALPKDVSLSLELKLGDISWLSDLFQSGALKIVTQSTNSELPSNLISVTDPFMFYYSGTFLVDALNNSSCSYGGASFFTRQFVADTKGPEVKLDIPTGVRADTQSATVVAVASDEASGIASAKLVVNGKVVAEKQGPASNVTLEYTFGKGEALNANEVKMVVVDSAGNESVARGSFAVQEVDGPTITDMSPVGEGIATATPTIGAAYSDPSGIDINSVVLTLNGAVLTGATVSESKVSYTPLTPLKAGVTYTVKLSVKDKAGSMSEQIWTFAIEKDAPNITDATPTGVDQTGMPLISAKFNDAGTGIDKSSVRLLVDKKTVPAEVTESTVVYRPTTVMSKGKHSVELSVADVAGNVKTHTWEFSIEEDAPVITDLLPTGAINTDMPVISAKYRDAGTGIDTSTVVLTLNGQITEATVTPTGVSYSVKEPLKPGVTYTAAVTVADKAGNVATSSTTFSLENGKPVISGMTPTGTVQAVNVAISANYSDAGAGIDVRSALMKVDGVVVPASASVSGISYQATNLLHGDHAVYVEVADKFGNVSSQSWTFKVEETPPTIASVEPKGEINTATPVIKATYSDAGSGINVKSVVLSLNGQVLPATATASQVSYEVLTPLEKGISYKVSVQVADMAGNIASADATFSLETTPPTISGTTPTGTVEEAEAQKGVAISAKLADDGSGVNPDSVKMWLDGALVPVVATAQSATYVAKGLGYGEHTVRLVVADMLGNTADKTWKFSVADSTPPTLTVISPKQDSVVGVRPVIKISYSDDGSGVDLSSISVMVDGKPLVASAMAPAKPGEAKAVSAGEASYEAKLGYGSHTLQVVVKDVAGNKAEAEVKFMVEGDSLEIVKPHNYPNPFAGDSTTITFGLSKRSKITIKIYDFTATLVATVAEDEYRDASEKVEFKWDGTTDAGGGRQLANGVYFCQIIAKTESETKREIVKIALVR